MFSIAHTVAKVLSLFDRREKLQAGLVVLLSLLAAFAESGGIVSVAPILAVAAEPSIIKSNSILHFLYFGFGFHSYQQFLIFLGVLSLVVLLIGIGFQSLALWANAQFVQMRNYAISRRLMLDYARRDYIFFLNTNSALLAETLLTEVQTVINGIFTPLMSAMSEGSMALALLIILCLADPLLALIVGVLLGGGYSAIYLLVGPWLDRIGKQRLETIQGRYLAAQELFGGIKDIRLLGCEEVYFDRFSKATYHYSRTQATSQLVSDLPRFIMEAVAFGTVLVLIIYLLNGSGDFVRAVPIIGLYAMAGRRLLPALQNVYRSASLVRFSQSALDQLVNELKSAPKVLDLSRPKPKPLAFEKAITFDHMGFKYPTAKQTTLHDINLTIPACARVGFVGPTGSGKTTLVDIVLGLLRPSSGQLLVDGVPIDDRNLRNWQALLGYVPQHIYLTDESVTKNIAFGIPPEEIDQEIVEQVARIANIHEFIIHEMPHGYDTVVGERGVRLSGGQRQRLGIARALYRQPQVLVFDEATSALDNVTEREFMKALAELGSDRTIITIAHRLSTVRNCDTIFLLEHGHLKASGTYDELVAGDERFRQLAATAH